MQGGGRAQAAAAQLLPLPAEVHRATPARRDAGAGRFLVLE